MQDKTAPSVRQFQEDEHWGKQPDTHAWFCKHIQIPQDWTAGEVRFSLRTSEEEGYTPGAPSLSLTSTAS